MRHGYTRSTYIGHKYIGHSYILPVRATVIRDIACRAWGHGGIGIEGRYPKPFNIGHNYVGRNYADHNCIGQTYTGRYPNPTEEAMQGRKARAPAA